MENNETDIIENAEFQELDKDDETAVDTDEKEKENRYPSQTVLTIRAIVGGYVLYLAYQIITSGNEISVPMWAAIILFIVAGSGLVIMSVKHFICGEYEGGKKDV